MLWHPVAVHFPIALLTAAVGLDIAALIARRPTWHRQAWILLLAGTAGAALSVLTGNLDASSYRGAAAAASIQDHEDLGTVTFLLFVVVCLGRLPGQLPGREGTGRTGLWVAVGVVGLLLLAWTAHQGGELVYDLGVGVRLSEGVP